MARYFHISPGEEVESIGGRYVVEKEERLAFGGREALVVYGVAVVDRSCCGTGGCRFALVPGFIEEWKTGLGPGGEEISEVSPVEDEAEKEKIREMIEEKEVYCQVNFI